MMEAVILGAVIGNTMVFAWLIGRMEKRIKVIVTVDGGETRIKSAESVIVLDGGSATIHTPKDGATINSMTVMGGTVGMGVPLLEVEEP